MNSQLEVLLPDYSAKGVLGESVALWQHGQFVSPIAPASDPTATFHAVGAETAGGGEQLLNDSGVVVGNVKTGSGNTVPGYWNSAHSSTFTEVSMNGVTCNGNPETSGRFYGVDGNGDAVGDAFGGGGGCAGLFVPGVGGVPAGTPQVFSSIDGTPIDGLDGISAGYETGNNLSEDAILVDRKAGTATQTDLLDGSSAFADNGTLTGVVSLNPPTNETWYLRLASGNETPLASANSSSVFDVNDAGQAVGSINGVGTLWDGVGESIRWRTVPRRFGLVERLPVGDR